jgi:hypothetical protein
MLTLADGGWRLAGRAQGVAARAPFLQARVADGAGRVTLAEANGRLQAQASIAGAQVIDAAKDARFNPLRMTGQMRLVHDVWTADLAFAVPAGTKVADARLTHDGRSGAGGVAIDTGPLSFAAGGLQPADLSPLAAPLGSPAQGQARFTGAFEWTKAGAASRGRLQIAGLDFHSPAGQVSGLKGEVAFTSLAPLVAPDGQKLTAERVDAFAPLTQVTASFGLTADALQLAGGEAAVGGGRVRIESLEVPLAPEKPTRGVLLFDGVQLHDMVEASPFGDHVDLDAKVSGRVPFQRQGEAIRIEGGSLKAIQPGRLSIQRAALASVSAEGGVAAPGAEEAPTTNTAVEFAYQAVEHLAFETLDAAIETRRDGRLGVLFHVIGKYDPPKHQELRLSYFDLIRRTYLNKKLPLPSGTGVNLTLDTSLNLNELLGDYADYERLRGSGAVQR